MEVSRDVHHASRHGENGTGGDLGRARLDEYIIKRRDDGVVDGILRAAAGGVDGGADPDGWCRVCSLLLQLATDGGRFEA